MLLSAAIRDSLPLILDLIPEPEDLISVDLTCSYLRKVNENSGWKAFATTTMGFPPSYKAEAGDELSWRAFLLLRVKPMHLRLARICSVDALRNQAKRSVANPRFKEYNAPAYERYVEQLKEDKFPPCSDLCRDVLSRHDWPLDVGVFIACHCYRAQAPLHGRSFFSFGYNVDEDSTESFAFFDEFSLGGGDTQWWSYVVLKGSVKVPLAPNNYATNDDRGESVEIGRGGIVAFSHWNHGGCQTTPKHIYPRWAANWFDFPKVWIFDFALSLFFSLLQSPLSFPLPSLSLLFSHSPHLQICRVNMMMCAMNG
jgi:hypothetical protein